MFFVIANDIQFGDPVFEKFDNISEVENFLLTSVDLDNIKVIKGEEMHYTKGINWA